MDGGHFNKYSASPSGASDFMQLNYSNGPTPPPPLHQQHSQPSPLQQQHRPSFHVNHGHVPKAHRPGPRPSKSSDETIQSLKSLVNLLVHFKYLLDYIKHHCFSDIQYKLDSIAPGLIDDWVICESRYKATIDSSATLQFVKSIEGAYQLMTGTSYCPFTPYGGEEDEFRNHSLNHTGPSGYGNMHIPDIEMAHDGSNQETVMSNDSSSFSKRSTSGPSTARMSKIANKIFCEQIMTNCSKELHGALGPTAAAALMDAFSRFPAQVEPTPEPLTNENYQVNESSHFPSIDQGPGDSGMVQVEYWCSFEGCRFKSKSLDIVQMHEQRRHVTKAHKCLQDGCDATFDEALQLQEHEDLVHALVDCVYKCSYSCCDLAFSSR